jgi:branched-chain amino acid transport system ATP-binding protein
LSDALVRAMRVARRYGDVEALAPTDLELSAGETVALVGANGAGKSTLLAIVAGALEPSEGTVETSVRLGWVPQRPAQYARLSPRENLELFARLEGVTDAKAAADELLRRFSLPEGKQAAGELSVGNRQRLNVALSLLGQPRVLLLDEPTQGLSVEETAQAVDTLARFLQASRMTVLLVEHDMEVVFRLAHRITVLHRGAVIADGAPAQVKADPAVQDAYLGGCA